MPGSSRTKGRHLTRGSGAGMDQPDAMRPRLAHLRTVMPAFLGLQKSDQLLESREEGEIGQMRTFLLKFGS